MAKGHLVFIGGGEDSNLIFNKIFELVGGINNVRLAIVPAASGHVAKTISSYEEYFENDLHLKKENIWSIPLAITDDESTPDIDESQWKDNAYNQEFCEKIKNYNIIFLVGGDQRKYIKVLKRDFSNSPLLNEIIAIYENGGVVAGTSAGSNIQGETIIAGGRSEEALDNKVSFNEADDDGEKLVILKGIGLISNTIIDTHFDVRGRIGRLIDATVITKNRFGFGIGEKTAIIYYPDSTIEIIGFGDVMVTDIETAKILSNPNENLHINNVKVHLFSHGDKFNLISNLFSPHNEKMNIKYTPAYDRSDYNISLDVFNKYEANKIIVKYMLDNEASDAIGIMGSEKITYHGDKSSFLRFVEADETSAFFSKLILENEEELSKYSGANVYVDVVPFIYENADKRSNSHEALVYSIENELQVIVFDKKDSLPVCDAKIELYKNNELIYRTGTNKFGKAVITKFLLQSEKYRIVIKDEQESHESDFIFEENMHGICMV